MVFELIVLSFLAFLGLLNACYGYPGPPGAGPLCLCEWPGRTPGARSPLKAPVWEPGECRAEKSRGACAHKGERDNARENTEIRMPGCRSLRGNARRLGPR